MIKVLFVCMGNICRSPTAEGVFRRLVVESGHDDCIEVDSAGTSAYHVGEPPDARSQETALRYGVDLSRQRSRQVCAKDFADFDYVVAMDSQNMRGLQALCPHEFRDRLSLLCDHLDNAPTRSVPDPYYGGDTGFDDVFNLVSAASEGLMRVVQQTLLARNE